MLRRVRFWIRASRVEFLTGSMMPVLVCGAMAWYETHRFHWGLWLLTLVAMMLIHAGANLANDYYDHVSGNDAVNEEYLSPFTGGSRVIQRGEVAAWQVAVAALLALGGGSLVGLYLVWVASPWILLLGLIGVGSAFFYTAPPLKLGYRGFGEPFIALDFGLLPAVGTYLVQTGAFSWGAVAAGLPNTWLITAVLFINQFQDMRADAAVGKRHWVVRLGRARAGALYCGLVVAAPVSLLAGVLLGWLPLTALLALAAYVPLPAAIRTTQRYYDDPEGLAPANAATIGMHLATGLLLTAGVWLGQEHRF